jgi:hypothetical protein
MDTEGNNILVKCNFQNEMGIKPKKQNPSECKTDQTTNICKNQPTILFPSVSINKANG